MTLRPCIGCAELIPSGSRCPECAPRDTRNARERGYDTEWTNLSRRARQLQPFCTDCGATENLQADHSPEAWQRRADGKPITLADIDVTCGTCNRRRGKQRR